VCIKPKFLDHPEYDAVTEHAAYSTTWTVKPEESDELKALNKAPIWESQEFSDLDSTLIIYPDDSTFELNYNAIDPENENIEVIFESDFN
jgi:hypothetical protein